MAVRKKKPASRTNAGTWKPGQSGNPKGRQRDIEGTTLRELARSHTERAIEVLAEIMETGKDKDRVSATNSILDRAWGKPQQSVDLSGDELEGIVVNFIKSPRRDS